MPDVCMVKVLFDISAIDNNFAISVVLSNLNIQITCLIYSCFDFSPFTSNHYLSSKYCLSQRHVMPPSQRLIFLDMGLGGTQDKTGRIASCNIDGSDQRTILDSLGPGPDGIAVDPEQKHIYWTNMGHPLENTGSICRCNIDGSNPVTIIPQGKTFTPKQCIISPGSRKLYWCDREGMRVMRANLDGSDIETLAQRGEGEEDRKEPRRHCVGIAVDEGRGLVYWTQKGKSKGDEGMIFRVGLEMPKGETPAGRSDVECLLERLPEPIDLDLDVDEQRLYVRAIVMASLAKLQEVDIGSVPIVATLLLAILFTESTLEKGYRHSRRKFW